MAVNAARAAAASMHRGEGVGVACVGEADCEMTDFLSGTNDGSWTDDNGEPPHSLSPYPHRLYHPLQTSGKCNGRPLDVTDVRYWYRLPFTGSATPYRTQSR